MRLAVITLLVCSCAGAEPAHAESVRVSLEWVELDCSKCPQLLQRLQSKQGHVAVADRSDPKFVALEKRAAKRVLVHHVQYIEPGTKTKHTTRIGEISFDLELGIPTVKNGAYETVFNVKRTNGAAVPAGLKPGAQLTPAQRKGVKKASMAFRVGLVPGQTLALFGSINEAKSEETVTVLVIGLEAQEGTSRVSQAQSAGDRR